MDGALEPGGPAWSHGEDANDDGDAEQRRLGGAETEEEGPVEPDRRQRQRGNGEADAGHRRAERQVDADLRPVATSGVDRGQRLRCEDEQGDDDPDE